MRLRRCRQALHPPRVGWTNRASTQARRMGWHGRHSLVRGSWGRCRVRSGFHWRSYGVRGGRSRMVWNARSCQEAFPGLSRRGLQGLRLNVAGVCRKLCAIRGASVGMLHSWAEEIRLIKLGLGGVSAGLSGRQALPSCGASCRNRAGAYRFARSSLRCSAGRSCLSDTLTTTSAGCIRARRSSGCHVGRVVLIRYALASGGITPHTAGHAIFVAICPRIVRIGIRSRPAASRHWEMIQTWLRDNAVVKVIEIDRRKELRIFGGRLVVLRFWESTHAGRSQADAGVVALCGIISGIDRGVAGMKERAGRNAVER